MQSQGLHSQLRYARTNQTLRACNHADFKVCIDPSTTLYNKPFYYIPSSEITGFRFVTNLANYMM